MLKIATDTATICIFDLTCLKHRIDDVGDWWSIPRNELLEVNNGNAIIINVGDDGLYCVYFVDVLMEGMSGYALRIPSGRFFVGQGEQLSGGGLEPDVAWGGEFREIDPGQYVCNMIRNEKDLYIFLQKGGDGKNHLDDLLRI